MQEKLATAERRRLSGLEAKRQQLLEQHSSVKVDKAAPVVAADGQPPALLGGFTSSN